MADNRPVVDIIDEQRRDALAARLRPVAPLPEDHEWTGVQVVTARDILEVFESEVELDYEHKATVTTPAVLLVDAVCPNCLQTIPDVSADLHAVATIEQHAVTKVKLKLGSKARTHTCGQQPLPKPPEVEGQVGMDEVEPGDEGMPEDPVSRDGPFDDDDDLLPGETP